ncbi:MAG TPA: biotin carboxylase N-terminal domain-containing protein, partial [Armatimonadota bacterium]|nr:biotin carboxylase N-terminal domain-containing protein [Armatimonadota bacterium]
MFKRILVANRSEIAVRIIRACHELGIEAIAVYSEADREALHVQMADHSVCIGPPAARESYLNVPNIMSAAMIHGCDAIHPGLGFLAENADFAEICETCGITFIGPTVEAIGKMGDKARARRIMHEAGVPVIRGTSEAVEDEASILKAAADFGYPLRVKASLGGGGRGIRIVHSEEELLRSVQLARAEAKAAFGSPDVYLERDVQEPRHIEVQIMADKHGNVCHLWERECSVQTRFNQKLLEEAPAPRLGRPLRRRLADLAVHAARAVGYVNAGTVEFLVDRYGNPFFLEMNTRLQVEHPVTEMTTGTDIVKEQI